MTQDTTPASGAADLPEALRLADLFELESDPESLYRLAAAELRRLHALAAGQATAAQQGAAYAALPTSSYAGRVYEEGFLIGTCPLYTADQMRAFADATHMLRASHGQAPAGATLYQIMAAAKELHAINHPTGEPEWDALRQCEIDALRRRAERILKAAAPAAPAQPAAEASRFGSPELQAMIIARCVEKDQADSVTAPAPPPECETEAEKRAFAFGWFKALESERMKADNKKKDPL